MVPSINVFKGCDLPHDVSSTYEWISSYRKTLAGIDNNGKSEGVVIRLYDRSIIRKIRFEDYERTLRARGSKI